jgi:dihydrofolate reductase
MRKLFWQQMVSVDGFMEGPDREIDWFVTGDEFAQLVADMGKAIDAIVFGRVTWQMMATYWPTSTEPEAPMMNDLPKLVFSRTLHSVDGWKNSRLAAGTIESEIAALKAKPGKDIAMFGSSDLAATLLRLRLIDEIRVLVSPVVLGRGNPNFKDVREWLALKLLQARPFRSGTVMLTYAPA